MYGYRTRRSMSSQKLWAISQPMAGKGLIFQGLILTVLSPLGYMLKLSPLSEVLLAIGILITSLVTFLRMIENKLKKNGITCLF